MIQAIDSHTGGEPTRIVIAGGPSLPIIPLAERVELLRRHHDGFRACVVNEPRGSDVLVGGLLVEPCDPTCAAGIIFFNNVGYLGMCGHGTIGLMTTLCHLGRIAPGVHRIETPVGIVTTELHADGRCSVQNVPSYRYAASVTVEVPEVGRIVGDIAWGGNWFFLVREPSYTISYADHENLTRISRRIREALEAQQITGANGALIDHVELFGPSTTADSRNFVLCPGMAYDRSPCGTGTSAKIACLAADGKLAVGQTWRQESVIGSVFEATYEAAGGRVLPTITGRAFITAELQLIVQPGDPFGMGISPRGD